LSTLLAGSPMVAALSGTRADASPAVLRARAGRRLVPPDVTGVYDPLTWYAPWLPEPAHIIGQQLRRHAPLTVRGTHRETLPPPEPLATSVQAVRPLLDFVADSTIDTLDQDCLAAWTPLPWLGLTGQDPHQDPAGLWVRALGPTGTALGVIDALSPTGDQPEIAPGAYITARTADWSHDLQRVRASGRLTVPWAPRPAFAHPEDAEALRYWYRRDTLAEWAGLTRFDYWLRDLYRQNPELGQPPDLGPGRGCSRCCRRRPGGGRAVAGTDESHRLRL
jgi:hypothetical protein